MLSIDEALDAIIGAITPAEPDWMIPDHAMGRILAERIVSPMDSPPFDKVLMDGFAVRAEDCESPNATLEVIETVTAGNVATQPVGTGQAIRIMTGCPLPEGADAIVRFEDTNSGTHDESDRVTITVGPLKPRANIMAKGESITTGAEVIPAGRFLGGVEMGAATELGITAFAIRTAFFVGVLATGDELVPVDQPLGPGQIRNSNEPMLESLILSTGMFPAPIGIARDNEADLKEKIGQGLKTEFLILSGGVSAGTKDLVPKTLTELGVREVFHKVHLKPGKPVWFGHRPASEDGTQKDCWVFGLPGNPVSSLVCFELFVRTAIRQRLGLSEPKPRPLPATLTTDHLAKGDRPTYYPARITEAGTGREVTPIAWRGSADLCSTVHANGMMIVPPGDHLHSAGSTLEVLPWARPSEP